MLSPFLGMDPYLEGSEWMSVQPSLCVEILRQLVLKVRPKYIVRSVCREVWDIDVKVPLVTVEIRDTEQRELVTVIEVLSPTNKRGKGYIEYQEKRGRILSSFAHLLEIDLLHRGKRIPLHGKLPNVPYFVFLNRLQKRPLTEIWPIRLDQRLPVVPVPLLPDDEDVPLDLQAAFDAVYDGVGYEYSVDYSDPPPMEVTDSEKVYINTVLHDWRVSV